MTEMKIIHFFAAGTPKAQPRPRAFFNKHIGQARVYEAGTAEAWKGEIALSAKQFVPLVPISGPVMCDLIFFFARPKSHYRTGRHSSELKHDHLAPHHAQKPDRDNLDKAVLDTLTRLGFWHDDGQVWTGTIEKLWADRDSRPGVSIKIMYDEPLHLETERP